MQKVFNLIAYLCSYIIKNCHEEFFVQYSCISPNEWQRICVRIERNIAFFAGNSVRPLAEDDFDDDFYLSLCTLADELKEEDDYFAIVGLVQCLDEALEETIKDKINTLQNESISLVLNSNRSSTGVGLLPRCSCIWERKRRLSHAYNRIDNFLFNLLLIDNSILGNLEDRHIFLKKSLFEGFEKTKVLNVAASPLRLHPHFDIAVNDSDRIETFDIEYDRTWIKKDNELVWEKILKASQNKADIVVFPELMGNYNTEDYISGCLMSLPMEMKVNMPSLIILPSYWKDNKNTVCVLDKFGNRLCHQDKQNPFRTEINGRGVLENIHAGSVINIFHCEGIGRIAILICKDFITTRYMERIMRSFKLTLIIVPSYTTGTYDFKQSFDLCAHDDCNVVWINSCAAMKSGSEYNFHQIGYIRKRINRFEDEQQKLCPMKICSDAFNGRCAGDCLYFEKITGV